MGTRIVYQIKDSDRNLIATLFSNSSHSKQFAEDMFSNLVADPACQAGPNALLEKLLTARYEKDGGNHQAGDRIFWVVPAAECLAGDHESVVTVLHDVFGENLAQRSAQQNINWHVERQTI